MLAREAKTAANIKDKTTRKDVKKALTSISEKLKIVKEIPETGLAIFAGCMLEELIYCGDMKGKLDLEKCRGYGCKLIESESVKLKEMGGVLGRRWY